ncbi:MAG: SDR family NAD(P)-dependent oxidoreductase [Myxococcota bacterium]
MGYDKPNPSIAFEQTPFVVNDTLAPWPRTDRPRRAAVNSLGVGGTNAFAVVEEAPATAPRPTATVGSQLLVLSARTRSSLDEASRRLAAHLRAHPELPLQDVAWTLAHGRRRFDQRRVLAASTPGEAATLLENGDPRRVFTHQARRSDGGVVFMFPGGGAQYAGMARDLYASEPVFRQHVDAGLAVLQPRVDHDVRALMFATSDLEGANAVFQRPSVQLPAILIVEHALAKLWERWGVSPSALIGHSMGENAAACVAGVMSLPDAIALVHLRGRLFDSVPEGGMLSVALPASDLAPLLGDDLELACINADDLCVATGPREALGRLEARLRPQEVETQRVAIDIAAHSRMLEPILETFRAHLRGMALQPPRVPLISNVTGGYLTDAQATDPDYWVEHLRCTVRFSDGLTTLADVPGRVYLEVGPGRALGAFARQHGRIPHDRVVSSLRHPEQAVDDVTHHLQGYGRLWACGVDVDLERLWEGGSCRRVPLPTYAFAHEEYFIHPAEGRPETEAPLEKTPRIRDWGYRPTWKRCAPEERPDPPAASWLLFLDDAGIGDRLAARLRDRGHPVVTVGPGDRFAKLGPDAYTLSPERGREGYDALVADLVSSGRAPTRIVHLWLLTADETSRPGSSFFHRNQERGFYSLFFLAQAIESEGLTRPLHLTVVSNGMQRVGDEALPYPEKATVLGPCEVIPHELSGVTCCSIDAPLPQSDARPPLPWRGLARGLRSGRARGAALDAWVTPLEEDLHADPSNAVIAYRFGKRWVRDHQPQPLEAAPGAGPGLREGGTYLITGGFGGVGAVMAETLARRCRARLVLLGRRGLPPRSQWDDWLRDHGQSDPVRRRIALVRELEALGAEVMATAGDVTNVEQMRAVVAGASERFGPIHGVIHAAGVVDDALMSLKDVAAVEQVFAPKVQGTLVLGEVFAECPPELMVLFSSTSTVTAPAGQVDYVAANAFLEAYADARTEGPTRIVALQWGVWNEVGMAVRALATKRSSPDAADGEPARGPLLDEMTRPTQGQTVLRTHLSPGTHWVVHEHRTAGGRALLPGTAFLELAAEALAEVGEESPFTVEDLYFLHPLYVPDVGGPREVRTTLVRSEEGYRMEVRARCDADGKRGWQLHAEARLSLLDLPPPQRLDLSAIQARCEGRCDRDPNGLHTGQARHVRFGDRWRVLREIRWGAGEALAHLRLPSRYEGDLTTGYRLHPALLDLATGFAMELIEGYDADRLWIPVSYGTVRVHARLPEELRSWVRVRDGGSNDAAFVAFDVVLTDPEGRVLVEVDELSLRHTTGDVDGTADSAQPAVDVEVDRDEANGASLSPGEEQLHRTIEHGIRPEEGAEAAIRVLGNPRLRRVVVSSIDLQVLCRQADRAPVVRTGASFARPQLATEYIEPRDDVERTLVGLWQELLGVERVGIRDSFFDLGGHSLIAVRLFARIKQTYQTEFPISALFEAPTIEACARLIHEAVGAREGEGAARPQRYRHLVAMHPAKTGPNTPFFLVAGMFGNVLNLRHLAHLVGTDRPFYGLQARGLFGGEAPHETFEAMAEAYLAEIRSVQPKGPYLLGGFSGGGLTAYEMARQLRGCGERVSLLAMLDTPLPQQPELTVSERARIQLHNLREGGPRYVGDWARSRLSWELRRVRERFQRPVERGDETFHNEAIEAAFRRAVARYRVRPYDGEVVLFRPAQRPKFVFGPERMVDEHKQFVFHDNGWGRYVRKVHVFEVPGDHDSMVLEPNVRVLASRLGRCIARAEAGRSFTKDAKEAEAAE